MSRSHSAVFPEREGPRTATTTGPLMGGLPSPGRSCGSIAHKLHPDVKLDCDIHHECTRSPQTGHTLAVAALTPGDVLRIPHLASLAPSEAAQLVAELVVWSVPARDLIAIEGEPCRGFFQLLDGRARLYRTGPDGREQIMRLLHPGDTFGEVPVFDGGGNPATIEALEECRVLLIPAAAFRRIIESHPRVALDLLGHFARRLRSFTELVEQISLQTVQQRVARYLYTTAREEGVRTAEGVVIQRTITQQDLAALVGSVREVVSRTMRVLEEDGLVELRRKEILVRDVAGLGRLL